MVSNNNSISKSLADIIRELSISNIEKDRIIQKNKRAKKSVNLPASSIINLLIKTAVESAKKNNKKTKKMASPFFLSDEEDKSYVTLNEDKLLLINSGYGTVSKGYGTSSGTSYFDYRKLFSHLGKFKSQSAYENFVSGSPSESMNRILEQDNKFYLVDNEVRDTGVRSMKYGAYGLLTNGPSPIPMGNINSSDWEAFKIWAIVEYVLFNLKMRTL